VTTHVALGAELIYLFIGGIFGYAFVDVTQERRGTAPDWVFSMTGVIVAFVWPIIVMLALIDFARRRRFK
jgi:undecaprenyl pyrophosphate phosphatase UppP